MAWLFGGRFVWYVGECFRARGKWPCYFVFGTAAIRFASPIQSRLALAYFGSTTTIVDEKNVKFSANRVRDRCNLVIKAAETHLTIVFNQQQGAQQVGSNTHYTKPKPALPVDRETTHTAAAQTGTTATARLAHPFYCSHECGTKAATPRYDTVTNAIVPVDIIYDLRLVKPNKKK